MQWSSGNFWHYGRTTLLCCVALYVWGCSQYQADSTRLMIDHLAELVEEIDPLQDIYSNARRVAVYDTLAPPDDPHELIHHYATHAQELLFAGHNEAALAKFNAARDGIAAGDWDEDAEFLADLADLLALTYLRLGEQENCLANHTAESCIFPIAEGGWHRLERGSRGAIDEYTRILTADPGNRTAQWLLNVAYMTLGEHEAQVPEQWRVPAAAFAAEYDIGRFPDVAAAAGVDQMGLAGGSILEDMDLDGDLDILVSSWGLADQLHYFRNNGDGTFTDRTAEAGLAGVAGGLNLRRADYNNDGYMDVLILRGAWRREDGRLPNSLLRNNGDGTFDDVTIESGLLSYHPTQTAAWGDYNNDGWLDLFIGNESFPGKHFGELFHNNGDGTFTETARPYRLAVFGYVKGVAWGDYDNDGLLDLYVSVLNSPNQLFHNDGEQENGRWKFSDVAKEAGVQLPVASFPTWFWDFDNDGWLDIFVSGYHATAGDVALEYLGQETGAEYPHLYRNNGDGTFSDVTAETGLHRVMYTMGSNFGDLDNDGWLDFYVGTGEPDLRAVIPNRMFRNAGGKFFQEVTASGGFGQLQKGHSVSFGDIDHDGDQDLYTVLGGAFSGDTYRNALYLNPGHGNHWVTLQLEGVTSNRSAIGTRLRLVVQTAHGNRTIYATVGLNSSFGNNSLQEEIGLGDGSLIRELEIIWPASGHVQRFENLAVDRVYHIREDDTEPQLVAVTPYSLAGQP